MQNADDSEQRELPCAVEDLELMWVCACFTETALVYNRCGAAARE